VPVSKSSIQVDGYVHAKMDRIIIPVGKSSMFLFWLNWCGHSMQCVAFGAGRAEYIRSQCQPGRFVSIEGTIGYKKSRHLWQITVENVTTTDEYFDNVFPPHEEYRPKDKKFKRSRLTQDNMMR